MNILILAPEFLPIRGGVGTYIVELIKNMPKDLQIHVLTPKRKQISNDNTKDESLSDNIHLHYVGTSNDQFFDNFKFQINCLRVIPTIIKNHNIDLIHSQSAMPDLFLPSKLIKVPIVTTIHTTVKDEIDSTISPRANFSDFSRSEKTMISLSPFLKFLENRYYAGNRYYITVSNWMKNHVITDFNIPQNKIKVIHNGVNVNTFNPSEKKKFGKYFPELSDINVPKVLCLSRWVERKGIRYFLKAIQKINKKNDIHFIFAGPVKKNKFETPSKNCTFLGYVPQEKIPCLFASCDIFLLPSLYENFPFVLLEAMSSSTAIISTNVGGIPELITHQKNGLLIRSQNSEDIIKSVIYLAENEQIRKTLGNEARMTVEKQFTWDKIALETCDYYKKIFEMKNK